MADQTADVVLAGAGLASSLIALRLKHARPDLRIAVLEQAEAADDSHTWSYFTTDVGPAADWLKSFERRRWTGYGVAFPAFARELDTPYASIEEARLQAALADALGRDLRFGARVRELAPDRVTLEGGDSWRAPLVIDGRGAAPSAALWFAWQKFRGLELRLDQPHGLDRPTVMDATVPQIDGFRFLYLLPFDERTVLVEDTRYSDGAGLDEIMVEDQALAYARGLGWSGAEVRRRETGVLPLLLGGDIDAFWSAQPQDVPSVGMRAALFHPTTGYSLPDAAHLADEIAAMPELTSRAVRERVEARSRKLWSQRGFYRALNRMLFLAARPDRRWKVLERFYRLPQPLIERFYAGRSTLADQARLLAGKPPVPVAPAMSALFSRRPVAAGAAR